MLSRYGSRAAAALRLAGDPLPCKPPEPRYSNPSSFDNMSYAHSRNFFRVVTAMHVKSTLPARACNAGTNRIPLEGRPSAAHPAAHTSTGSMEQGRLPHYWVQAGVVTLPLPSSPLPHPLRFPPSILPTTPCSPSLFSPPLLFPIPSHPCQPCPPPLQQEVHRSGASILWSI